MTGPFLPLAGQIIRFYLGERPLLRSLPTYWLGDIDQREMVLSDIEKFTIRPLFGEKVVLGGNGRMPSAEQIEEARQLILRNAAQYVAQPQDCDALTDYLPRWTQGRTAAGPYSFRLAKVGGRIRGLSGSLDACLHGGIALHCK